MNGDARTGHAGALSGTEPAAAWLVSALAVSDNDWAWARNDDDSPPVGHPARLPPASPPASPPVGMPEARDLHPAHPHSRSSARPPPAGTRARARRRQGGFPPRDPDAPPHAGRHGHMRAGARLRGRPGAPAAAPGAAPGSRSVTGLSQEFGLASSHFPNWALAILGWGR